MSDVEVTTRAGGVLAATCLSTLVVNANTSAVSILLPAISEYPVTAHCSVVTLIPVSSLIAGSRMLTAEVLALTTSVERQVAARTPPARVVTSTSLMPSR